MTDRTKPPPGWRLAQDEKDLIWDCWPAVNQKLGGTGDTSEEAIARAWASLDAIVGPLLRLQASEIAAWLATDEAYDAATEDVQPEETAGGWTDGYTAFRPYELAQAIKERFGT